MLMTVPQVQALQRIIEKEGVVWGGVWTPGSLVPRISVFVQGSLNQAVEDLFELAAAGNLRLKEVRVIEVKHTPKGWSVDTAALELTGLY